MTADTSPPHNVTAVVPLVMVTSMECSLAFCIDGLGFTTRNRWMPDGHLRWYWISLAGAALMGNPFPKGSK